MRRCFTRRRCCCARHAQRAGTGAHWVGHVHLLAQRDMLPMTCRSQATENGWFMAPIGHMIGGGSGAPVGCSCCFRPGCISE